MGQYTKAVGTKFNEDGSLRRFPGNTVICKTVGIQPLSSELEWAQQQYQQLPFAGKFSFLPPSSFHMTVFDLVCDQVRDPQHWSTLVAADTPIEEVDEVLRRAVQQVIPPAGFTMQIDEPAMGIALVIRLRAVDAENEVRLRNYRNELANATGIRSPNHDSYGFHISLAYILQPLTEDEKAQFTAICKQVTDRLRKTVGAFELRNPEFVLFNDMGEFQSDLSR